MSENKKPHYMFSKIWEIKQVVDEKTSTDVEGVFDVLNPYSAILSLMWDEDNSNYRLFTAKGFLLKEKDIFYTFNTLEDGMEFCKNIWEKKNDNA
tara:strand:+ start:30 stop:314 length:285 start_codon:yes stop_codon:yes gene_type:complete